MTLNHLIQGSLTSSKVILIKDNVYNRSNYFLNYILNKINDVNDERFLKLA